MSMGNCLAGFFPFRQQSCQCFSHRTNRCFFAAVCIPFIGTILLKGGGGVQADDKFRVVVGILYYAALGAAVYFAVRYLLCWTLPFFLGAGVAALLRPATLKFAKKRT